MVCYSCPRTPKEDSRYQRATILGCRVRLGLQVFVVRPTWAGSSPFHLIQAGGSNPLGSVQHCQTLNEGLLAGIVKRWMVLVQTGRSGDDVFDDRRMSMARRHKYIPAYETGIWLRHRPIDGVDTGPCSMLAVVTLITLSWSCRVLDCARLRWVQCMIKNPSGRLVMA